MGVDIQVARSTAEARPATRADDKDGREHTSCTNYGEGGTGGACGRPDAPGGWEGLGPGPAGPDDCAGTLRPGAVWHRRRQGRDGRWIGWGGECSPTPPEAQDMLEMLEGMIANHARYQERVGEGGAGTSHTK